MPMTDQTKQQLNQLLHDMNVVADHWKGLKYAFGAAKMPGLALFARNEAMEMWRYTKYIADFMIKNDAQPMIQAMPAPKQDYGAPNDALNAAKAYIDALCQKFMGMMTKAAGMPDVLYMLQRLHSKIADERHELDSVIAKMQQGQSVPGLDAWLYREYSEEYEYDHEC